MDEIQPQEDKADWFKLLEQERSTGKYLNLSDVEFMSLGNGTHQLSSISSSANASLITEHAEENDTHEHKRGKRRRFFQRNFKNINDDSVKGVPQLSKEELECPFIASNIDDLQTAVLLNKIPLRDVGFRFPIKGVGSEVIFGQQTNGDERKQISIDIPTIPSSSGGETTFHRHDPIINGSLSSLLTYKAKTSSDPTLIANYQHGIELLSHHPVLSLVRERVLSKSKPGRRLQGSNSPSADIPHLALVIEGGGMRGAVSAGMAAALSTLDLLDAFDSIHGSSAGSIVGAYLVSRQLCMDVYTDIMPASGNKFVSKRGGLVNFGVDWLGDLIQRKLLTFDGDEQDGSSGTDDLCVDVSGADGENVTSWVCEEDLASSVALALGTSKRKQSGDLSRSTRLQSDDQYGGIVVESMNYLLSNMFNVAKSSVSKSLLFGARRFGRAIRPTISALDVASSMRQYLRRRPGMNITYVLDGVMDESHGLRPFDVHAFQANDKLQPLYMIASTVSNGGKGEMETGKAQIIVMH
jgi:predicted patatin/cPLA2 family phospholipase